VLAQRGKLAKMREAFDDDPRLATLAFCLRVAVILHRSRRTLQLPKLAAAARAEGYHLAIESGWLENHSLVRHALDEERKQWQAVGMGLELEET
jgi:exopolyphosphatase / guanosine-5'-triphosphate,3'-diphosphate pyrophosphatase